MKGKTNVIALACHKGGVGKTTTAASLGGVLAARGERVLLVDLDPQMNLTTTFTDGFFERTVYDAFTGFKRNRRADLPVYPVRDNLDIVPSQLDMSLVDTDFASFPLRELMLRKMLEPLKGNYDWVFIDCPAELKTLTTNAFVAADSVLIPLTCDAYAVDGLNQVMGLVELVQEGLNPPLRIIGIAVTKFRSRRVTDQVVAEELEKHYGKCLFNTRIRESAAIARAPLEKKDIYVYDRSSAGAVDYAALADEIVKSLKRRQP